MALADPLLEQSLLGAILSRRFRLTEELGRGGMGVVFAAAPVDGSRPVAVKILHAAYVEDPQVLTRFLEEGRTCMRLVHPNILRVHECLTAEDGSPYLVMDLLDGVPLSAYTKNGGRLSLAHAVPILQGMLAGLAGAHEQGVVHRDLKPANVFLARDAGGLFIVKLLDFGIAKVMDAAGGMGSKTRTGMLLGTPAYMSPEQIRNAKDVDGRADLWSAGVMFYEMLTGRTAFPAPTEYARLSAVLQNTPEPVGQIDPALLPLEPFIARAMQKDRALRFQSAREMADALAALSSSFGGPGRAADAASAGVEPASRVVVSPLSRLPGNLGASEGGRVWVDPNTHTAPSVPLPAQVVDDLAPTRFQSTAKSPGGTLASPNVTPTPFPGSGGTPQRGSHPPVNVVVVPSSAPGSDGMLGPSSRMRRGVPPWVVVLLVLGALAAGLALGFALGRSM